VKAPAIAGRADADGEGVGSLAALVADRSALRHTAADGRVEDRDLEHSSSRP
jgi:hypothetical protein